VARRRLRTAAHRAGLAVLAIAAVALLLALALTAGGAARAPHGRSPAAARGPERTTAARAKLNRAQTARQMRAERRVLSYAGYIRRGGDHAREVALTFDDGPGPYTLRILAILQRFHVRATFFEIGRQVRSYRGVTRRLAGAGMTIGDHTEDHLPLALLSPSRQALQIDRAADAIAAAGAPAPSLFRPPYGSYDAATMTVLRARRMLMVLWTVDTGDYARPGAKRIAYVAISGARPGAIILFHDGGGDRSQTVVALARIIQRLQERGYALVSVAQLLADDPPPATEPAPRGLAGD
jgi:peptidoglycan-N-acetylglucosamine deacetylase